jgi:hypothetical protein
VLGIWTLASHREIDGVLHMSLPFSWFMNTKFLNQILPVRVSVYVARGTAVAAALWLSCRLVWWPLRWALFQQRWDSRQPGASQDDGPTP